MISVCIATYNGEKYIREQIESIITQIGANDEIVVSDNYSADSTIGILESYNDNRIKILRFKKESRTAHEAVASNFENALNHCSGDYIFLSDQDDIWMEGKLKLMMEYLKEGYDLVTSDMAFMYNGKKDIDNRPWRDKSPKGNWLITLPQYYGCCMAFNRKLLNVALPFPKHLPLHDGWLGILGEMIGKTYHINIPLIYYRRNGNNVSGHSDNSLREKITYRMCFYYYIIVRTIHYYYRKFKSNSFLDK